MKHRSHLIKQSLFYYSFILVMYVKIVSVTFIFRNVFFYFYMNNEYIFYIYELIGHIDPEVL